VLGRVHPAQVELAVRGSAEPDAAVQRELFRIAQEALQNALKHAGASRIAVELDLEPGKARLAVVDDGAGFEPSDPRVRSQHLGVTVMAERARAVGGRLDLRSAAGAGTTVAVEVPRG
jgi:signal transduction histidine kinase